MSTFVAALHVTVSRWEEDITVEEYLAQLEEAHSDINCWEEREDRVTVMVAGEFPDRVGPGGGVLIFDGAVIAAYEEATQIDRVLDEYDAS